MNSSERFAAIRAKCGGSKSCFVASPTGMHAAANPQHAIATKGRKAEPPTNQGHRICAFAGPIMPHRTNSMMDWIYAPEPKQKKEKRLVRRESHYLNKIAAKWTTLKRLRSNGIS